MAAKVIRWCNSSESRILDDQPGGIMYLCFCWKVLHKTPRRAPISTRISVCFLDCRHDLLFTFETLHVLCVSVACGAYSVLQKHVNLLHSSI